ncbi:MAG: hypothetical protein M1820_001892 [Bogoriella megaspora]|nr:MAG: hypothetical protein M1820_001892 [Bogoriella megaspora]
MTSIGTILDFEYLQNETPSGIKRSLPFLNAKYRSQVRVVDYYPDKLEDFARSLDNKSYNDVPDSENEDSDIMGIDTVPPKRWEWAFYILVEDAKKAKAGARSAYLPLTVSGSDAEYLLKLDATDLRRDRDNLASLREKLFILWGDLQEVKEKAMHGEQVEPNESGSTGYACSSRPFECCIMEYGMPSPSAADNEMNPEKNWTRTFKMFGTTIMN